MSEEWENDPRFRVDEKPKRKRKNKTEEYGLNISESAKIKAKKVWDELPPMDKGDYRDFNDFVRRNEWGTATDRLSNVSPEKVITLYGVNYPKKAYIKQFIPECYINFKVATKQTSLRNTKIIISQKSEGKYWNADSQFPVSQNEFITKFFDDDEEKIKGIEGIWYDETWGLIGIVKKGSYYQRYNIDIEHFDNTTPAENFNNNDGGANLYEVESDFPEPNDLYVNGTLDGAYIPTSNKKKFRYESRHIILAKVDNVIAPINIESTMQMTLINDNLMQIRPPYGNSILKSERIWPTSLERNEDGDDRAAAGSGTAFFVDDKGHIVTNHHVVKDAKNNLKIIYKNKELEVDLIASDKKLDLALLKANVKNKSYISVSSKKPEKLQDIIASGYPGGKHLSDDLKFTSGIVSSLKGANDNSAHIQTDLALNHGNSGGPIVDKETGELVAVAVSGLRKDSTEGINFGIKASQVKDFLESNHIKKTGWKLKRAIKRSELLSLLESSTVYIYFK